MTELEPPVPKPLGRNARWLLGLGVLVIGAVLAPFLGLFAYGLFLDPSYESQVVAVIQAPPLVLAESLADPAQQEKWRPGASAVEVLAAADGRPRIQVTAGETKIEMERKEATASRVVWEVIPSRKHVFEGTWTWDLTPEGDGTRIVLVERGVITSPFARAAAESFFGLDRWSRASLTRLAQQHGAKVVFE